MELKAYFSGIDKIIIKHLEQSDSNILAAIPRFTDKYIFDVLCRKAQSGVKVSVALFGEEANLGAGGLQFDRLRNHGGEVILLPPGSCDDPRMQYKFCVIDSKVVITGSYNWSYNTLSNDENITVVTNSPKLAGDYLETFHGLLIRAGQEAPVISESNVARRRLELIRNLVLLGEQEDIPDHVRKLRPIAETLQISQIITALDRGEFKVALEKIEAHLRKANALVATESAEIPKLRFLLETLELRLESLTDEKADLERSLITFNRRNDDALGDLIQCVLKARAELSRLMASSFKSENERKEAEAAAEEAENTYHDYSRQHESLQREEPLPELDADAERELKSLYRKACSLCHPDKVPEDKKEAAHRVFVDLQDAYKANDISNVREIHAMLVAGGLLGSRSSTLNETSALKAAIAEMEFKIAKLVSELNELLESDGAQLMSAAGPSESDWAHYFEHQKQILKDELARLVSAIQYEESKHQRVS